VVNNFADHIEELGEIAVAVLVAGPDFGGEMRVTFAVRGKIMSRTGRADAGLASAFAGPVPSSAEATSLIKACLHKRLIG